MDGETTKSSKPSSVPNVMSRLVTAARLAHMRPEQPVVVEDPTQVRTSRVVLRPLVPNDRAAFLDAYRASRAELARHCPLDKPEEGVVTDDAVFDRQRLLSDRALETGLAWRRAAFDRSGRCVGAMAINDIRRGLEHSGEFVMWIRSDLNSKGLAKECLRATMAVAFADLPRGLGLHRLTALASPGNEASRRVLRACGFALVPDGISIDLILSGRTAPHDLHIAYAPLSEAGRPAPGDETVLRRAIASIAHADAMACYAV